MVVMSIWHSFVSTPVLCLFSFHARFFEACVPRLVVASFSEMVISQFFFSILSRLFFLSSEVLACAPETACIVIILELLSSLTNATSAFALRRDPDTLPSPSQDGRACTARFRDWPTYSSAAWGPGQACKELEEEVSLLPEGSAADMLILPIYAALPIEQQVGAYPCCCCIYWSCDCFLASGQHLL